MWCIWVSSVARSCATRNASNKKNVCEPTLPAGINRPPPSKTISLITRIQDHLNRMDCLKGDFQAFGATGGSTVDNRLTFGVDRAVWTLSAKMNDGAPWHKGVLQGSGKIHDLLAQGRRGGQPTTCDQTRLS